MHAVVTGGYGFIGSHLVSALLERGDQVTVFDLARSEQDTSLNFDEYPSFSFVQGDVTDSSTLDRVIGPGVDVIYHLSAIVGIKNYIDDPLKVLDVNVGGTRNILELARTHGVRVVLASTSEVFGKNPAPPWSEDDDRVLGSTRTARWSYSTSKAMAEHIAFAMHDSYGVPVTVVRYFNVYGPRQRPIFVVSQSVHRALNGHAPYLYDGGDQTRCFTYVDDAVRGTILAAESDDAVGEAFNIGSMVETSMRDVVQMTLRATGTEGQLEPIPLDTTLHYGSTYEDIPKRIPDTAKAERVLGWKLEVDVEEGIRRTVDWSRANPWYLEPPVGGFTSSKEG